MNKRLRIAIVGGGAAAVGVLSGLEALRGEVDVILFDLPPAPDREHEPDVEIDSGATERAWRITPELIAQARRRLGWRFPPPKSHFGDAPPALEVENWGRLWRSTSAGGLTRFWGGCALPYPDDEFARWPFPATDVRPHYEAIVRTVPVSGEEDALSRLWSGGLASRPALPRSALFDLLIEHVQQGPPASDGYEFFAGSGRMAVETAPTSATRCRLAGACMIGCPHAAVFSAGTVIRAHQRTGLIREVVYGEVRSFHPTRRTLTVLAGGAHVETGSFDLIFITAGCLGSTTIVLRSVPRLTRAFMQDNSVYSFPLLYLGRDLEPAQHAGYFGLTNAVVACRPVGGGPMSTIQLYPFFDLLWQYYLPSPFWTMASAVAARIRNRVAIARLYAPAEHSQRYSVELSARGEPKLSLETAPTPLERIPGLWRAVRMRLSGNGFRVPSALRSAQATSSHYAGTLPMGGDVCSKRGEVARRVYLCDSAAFPESSAFSPTLTIMAVARKRAVEAIRAIESERAARRKNVVARRARPKDLAARSGAAGPG